MIDIKQGDCLELMKKIPDKSIDMILCDLWLSNFHFHFSLHIHEFLEILSESELHLYTFIVSLQSF